TPSLRESSSRARRRTRSAARWGSGCGGTRRAISPDASATPRRSLARSRSSPPTTLRSSPVRSSASTADSPRIRPPTPQIEIGTANLLTPERIAAAAALVKTGKRFSLALPIGPPTPGGYRSEPLHFYGMAAGDAVLGGGRGGAAFPVSDDYVVMALQASTQIDGFGHVGGDSVLYNGYWAGLVNATSGARRLGIHHLARGIVGRAVLLDVARHLGVEPL